MKSSRRTILATAVAVATLARAASADQYVCNEVASTGFFFNQGTWQQTPFIANLQFHVALSDDGQFSVAPIGGPNFAGNCFSVLHLGYCLSAVESFYFDARERRFMRTLTRGFVSGDGPETPLIAIGTCAELGG